MRTGKFENVVQLPSVYGFQCLSCLIPKAFQGCLTDPLKIGFSTMIERWLISAHCVAYQGRQGQGQTAGN